MLHLVRGGVNAGYSYGEVCSREYGTIIGLSMEVMPDSLVRKNLDMFFAFQGEDGNIVDGFIPVEKADLEDADGYEYRFSELAPGFAAHKNTVETDHETSLVQAVAKYVRKSGNWEYLGQKIGDCTVHERLVRAMEFLLNEKTDSRYGLLVGATPAEVGEVQPEQPGGV